MNITPEEFELLAASIWQSEPRASFGQEMYALGSSANHAAYANVEMSPGSGALPAIKLDHVGALSNGDRVFVQMANNRAYIVGKIPQA